SETREKARVKWTRAHPCNQKQPAEKGGLEPTPPPERLRYELGGPALGIELKELNSSRSGINACYQIKNYYCLCRLLVLLKKCSLLNIHSCRKTQRSNVTCAWPIYKEVRSKSSGQVACPPSLAKQGLSYSSQLLKCHHPNNLTLPNGLTGVVGGLEGQRSRELDPIPPQALRRAFQLDPSLRTSPPAKQPLVITKFHYYKCAFRQRERKPQCSWRVPGPQWMSSVTPRRVCGPLWVHRPQSRHCSPFRLSRPSGYLPGPTLRPQVGGSQGCPPPHTHTHRPCSLACLAAGHGRVNLLLAFCHSGHR
ncbi:hypothetical protein H1C71_014870, partial [Ictidomys tridecemlineatus]